MVTFGKPLAHAYVTSGWGDPRTYRDGTHQGLDFRATSGLPVFAVASGAVVTSQDTGSNTGKWIAIQHSDGYLSRYLHLSRRDVKVGAIVTKGQQIGLTGSTGITSSAPHLHFDLKQNGKAVPAEPLIPVDQYADKVVTRAIAQGLALYGKPTGTGQLAIGLGAIYLLWRLM